VLEHLLLIRVEFEGNQTIIQVDNHYMGFCEVYGIRHALGIFLNLLGIPVFLDSIFLYMGIAEVVVIAR
jgi:hypothetical protein